MGHACALHRTSADPAEVLRLNQRALEISSTGPGSHFCIGLAQLRAGAAAEAVQSLNKAAAAEPGGAWLCWPALALAHHARGERAEALRWLAKAETWQAEAPGRADGTTGLHLGEGWLDFQILYREAYGLLQESRP